MQRPDLPSMKAGLIAARFVARPNRFIVIARLDSGREVMAHLADPGRLRELLLPDVRLRLRPAPPGSERRTRYSVALVRSPAPPHPWVSLDSTLANRLVIPLLEDGVIRGVPSPKSLRREVTRGHSRFDFLLQPHRSSEVLVEVKSVTLVENGVGRFPDAPTLRGARHVRELTDHVRHGGRALVLFCVQRDDARCVCPNPTTDPGFAETLWRAREAGVLLRAVQFQLRANGSSSYLGPLPVRMRGHRPRA